jgi:hypothetical protein
MLRLAVTSPMTVLLYALGAGIAAGIGIGLIILGADLKVFFLATPVGAVVGLVVRRVAPGMQDAQHVGFALAGTVAGVVVARYFVWVEEIRDALRELARLAPGVYQAPSAGSLFTRGKVLSEFVSHPGLAFGWRGALALGLGLLIAGRIVTRG